MGTPVSYLSYVSQPTVLPSTPPLKVNRSSSQFQSQRSNQSQHHQQHLFIIYLPLNHQNESNLPSAPTPNSLITFKNDSLSPPHSLQHHTTALTNLTSATHHFSSGITSFSYDRSFFKTSSSIERFFKILYYMPWIAYERITVDCWRLDVFMDMLWVVKRVLGALEMRGEGVVIGGGKKQGTSMGMGGGGSREELVLTVWMAVKNCIMV